MQKNSILFIVFSIFTISCWYFLFTPKQQKSIKPQRTTFSDVKSIDSKKDYKKHCTMPYNEELINIETDSYKAVLTTKGASVLSWTIKEKNGKWVNLVPKESTPVMANLPEINYKVVSKTNKEIVFEYKSMEGWKIVKTYSLSSLYMHNLKIYIERNSATVLFPKIKLEWGPGLGTDSKEMKENITLTRALAYTEVKPNKLKKLKNNSETSALYKWVAIDNRYFLVAFIPENPSDFDKIISSKPDKKHPYSVTITTPHLEENNKKNYSINFYLGPKGYTCLKSYRLGLEKTIDFGFFGFLGKIAFASLALLYNITHNYGWAIVMLTAIIQFLVLPLTLKSFKSTAVMKEIQPIIKDIQIKYKDNPRRLQAEMLNAYKSQKINPLGGCLPMLLQLPIFWAFFTVLRNTYELRNEGWMLWIKDLSAPDQFMHLGSFNFNLLPLIMGIGMFFQQKMTALTSDPTQNKIMYITPILFIFMFWAFPSGLVLYWITNSVISMIEQYFVIKKSTPAHIQ
ncbi:MAG: membrane protein insertase YidC [Endomicrobium sp.]|jgi:YidC/Oxa1 family membrane protein insertase|nr:membrane protein insertase YidC [Endomicrobium sp.]